MTQPVNIAPEHSGIPGEVQGVQSNGSNCRY